MKIHAADWLASSASSGFDASDFAAPEARLVQEDLVLL
jgi:hypothetical protein